MKDKNIVFGDPKGCRNICLGFHMTKFAVNRDRIFGMHQRIDQFDLFLAGMTGYMHILEDHLGSHHGQLIDDPGNCFLISRNRIGTQDHGVPWFHLYLPVHICCHP